MPHSVVPHFFLYGEPPRATEERFLHLEEIDDRSRPAAWRIQPHAHSDLHQVFAIRQGGGTIAVESETIAFAAPAVLVVPAGTVHGFVFEAGTAGKVLTLVDALLRHVVRSEPAFASVFEAVRRLDCNHDDGAAERLDALAVELAGSAPARRGALAAHIALLLVTLTRMMQEETASRQTPRGTYAEIVARFRGAVEQNFHRQAELDDYCRWIGTTIGRLRTACRSVADTTPGRILAQRVILEAKRELTYSDLPVSEIAFGLGFSDPAYFSRYFARGTGCSPTAFRLSANGTGFRDWNGNAPMLSPPSCHRVTCPLQSASRNERKTRPPASETKVSGAGVS